MLAVSPLTAQQRQDLLALLDLAVRQGGLNVAPAASFFKAWLEQATAAAPDETSAAS